MRTWLSASFAHCTTWNGSEHRTAFGQNSSTHEAIHFAPSADTSWKAARAASEKSKGEKPVYHLNAMYERESIGVVVKRVGEKENEISCLPAYLEQFELSGTIVTMDAIGCNQTVIKTIK